MKKILALIWIAVLCFSLLLYSILESPPSVQTLAPEETQATEATEPPTPQETTTGKEDEIQLYFLNGQPVLQVIWNQLADEFAEQTGISIKTISSQAHLQGESPVLFSVSTSEELGQWDCLDLSDTVAYANLASPSFTLTQDGKVLGIASEAEPFGLIYHIPLLARVGYTGSDIDSFQDLKTVAELITAQQSTLNFGAFAKPDDAGRFAALLSAVPEDTKAFWDLYHTNVAEGSLSDGNAVFQLGTLSDMVRLSAGGTLQLQMLPLYTGTPGEDGRGLSCFGKHFWCVREDASPEEIRAALAFLSFLVSPRLDGTVPADDLCILSPYRQAVYANNPVAQQLRQDIALGKALTVCGAEPQDFPQYAQALLTYASVPTGENWIAAEQAKASRP